MTEIVQILGGRSLVGGYLIQRLLNAGYAVEILGRHRPNDLPEGVSFRLCDITAAAADSLRTGSPVFSLLPLWVLPQFLASQIHRPAQIIALGSTSRFSKQHSPSLEEQELAARLTQAETDIAQQPVPWTVLRPTLIYDGVQDQNITRMAAFIRRFRILPLVGAANGLRQPIHADDVAAFLVACLHTPAVQNKALTITGGETLTYRAMAIRVFEGLGLRPRFLPLPLPILRLAFQMIRPITRWTHSPALFNRMNEDLAYRGEDAATILKHAARAFHPKFL
jgi:nucleoside-diphosphate-sugar epimerase